MAHADAVIRARDEAAVGCLLLAIAAVVLVVACGAGVAWWWVRQ